jgi:hypothetical protein
MSKSLFGHVGKTWCCIRLFAVLETLFCHDKWDVSPATLNVLPIGENRGAAGGHPNGRILTLREWRARSLVLRADVKRGPGARQHFLDGLPSPAQLYILPQQ